VDKTVRSSGHLLNPVSIQSTTKARYTLATKSTASATKLNVLATKSTATSCRIHVVADLLPKPATKLTISATVNFVADLLPVSATVTFNKDDRVEFNFVTSVYRALHDITR